MIIRVFSHKDCMAINTDKINAISVDYALDKETKFISGVAVEFDIANDECNNVIFSVDISPEDFKINAKHEIQNLKKCVIAYIVTRICKSCDDIDIDHAVIQALHRILQNREEE